MLVIRRKVGQSVDFDGPAEITLLGTSRGEARFGIVTDETVKVERLSAVLPDDIRELMKAYMSEQDTDSDRARALERLRGYLREAERHG